VIISLNSFNQLVFVIEGLRSLRGTNCIFTCTGTGFPPTAPPPTLCHSTNAPHSYSSQQHSYQKDKRATPENLWKAVLFLISGSTGHKKIPDLKKYDRYQLMSCLPQDVLTHNTQWLCIMTVFTYRHTLFIFALPLYTYTTTTTRAANWMPIQPHYYTVLTDALDRTPTWIGNLVSR